MPAERLSVDAERKGSGGFLSDASLIQNTLETRRSRSKSLDKGGFLSDASLAENIHSSGRRRTSVQLEKARARMSLDKKPDAAAFGAPKTGSLIQKEDQAVGSVTYKVGIMVLF